MNPPRFLFAPDPAAKQLYIIHTQFPLSIILVQQDIPAKLFIVETELYPEDDTEMEPGDEEILSQLLRDAAEFYRHNAIETSN
jgi:hypothetical protein